MRRKTGKEAKAMLTCAILDDYQNATLSRADFSVLASQVKFDVYRDHIEETDALIERLKDYDMILAMRERTPFGRDRLSRLPQLKLLITTGLKNASIDAKAAQDYGITVCGTPGFPGSTAELTWGLLLSIMRHMPYEMNGFKNADPHWQLTVGRDLQGLTLGVMGLGTLGARVARYGRAFDMQVLGYSRSLTDEQAAAMDIIRVSGLDEMSQRADIMSIHMPLNAETRGLIGAQELARMKPGVILLNTSRGPIIDEAALIAALQNGHVAAAGLDVFDIEPLPADHPFRRMSNVHATPHLGYVTENSYRTFFKGAIEAITAFLAGKPILVIT
jgi:phosphoglycerate dehydrogenase-like enzyme